MHSRNKKSESGAERRPGAIAVVGMACRVPGADDYSKFWRDLAGGVSRIREIPEERWNARALHGEPVDTGGRVSKWCGIVDGVEFFDNQLFNITPREAKCMDPQQRVFLEESWRCVEDAGIPLERLRAASTAVIAAVMATDYQQIAVAPDMDTDAYACQGNYQCMVANRVSYILGLKGPSLALDAGCAGSLVAIHQAVRALRQGDCEYALAGGVSLNLHPWKYISFSKARMLSPDGQCKTFDKDANGYVPGDGCGVVLLQRLEDALAQDNHIHGVICGTAVNHGGAAPSLTAPRVEAQRDVIVQALGDAGLDGEAVSYVEAHGTGTSLGDPIEIEALTQAYWACPTGSCLIGSVKTNIGHLEAAAGVVGLIKVLLMLKHRQVAPTLNLHSVNPMIDFGSSPFRPATALTDWNIPSKAKTLCAGISSFGFGGVNSHVLVEEASPRPAMVKKSGPYPFFLSARTSDSLQRLIMSWQRFADSAEFQRVHLRDLCGTLATGREPQKLRVGRMVRNGAELRRFLAEVAASPSPLASSSAPQPMDIVVGTTLWNSLAAAKVVLGRDYAGRILALLRQRRIKDPWRTFSGRRWTNAQRPGFSLLAAYAHGQNLFSLGLKPHRIFFTAEGTLLGLSLAGALGLEEAWALAEGRLAPEDVRLKRPQLPFFDPVAKGWVRPYHFDAAQVLGIFDGSDLPGDEFEATLAEGRLLYANQHTFRRLMLQWHEAVPEAEIDAVMTGASPAPNLRWPLYLMISSATHTVRRKWNLRSESVSVRCYGPAIRVMTSEVVARLDLARFLLGDLELAPTVAAQMNAADFKPASLEGLSQELTELGSFGTWMKKVPATLRGELAGLPALLGDFKPSLKGMSLAGRSFVEVLLDLQLAGQDMAWETWFGRFQKVPLPVYAFDKKPYWLHGGRKTTGGSSQGVVSALSRGSDNLWYRRVSAQHDAVIRDTVVDGLCITPSPLRLEMALQAAKRERGPHINSLRRLRFPTPGLITITADFSIEIAETQVTVSEGGRLLCQGDLEARDQKPSPDYARPGADESAVSKAEIYELFATWGYHYGPGMCVIDRIVEDASGFHIDILPQPTAEGQLSGLDPFVLDGMFQGVFYAGHRLRDLFRGGYLYVPLTVERLTLWGDLSQPVTAVLPRNGIKVADNGDMLVDFHAFGPGGDLVLEVVGIYFKRVQRSFLRDQTARDYDVSKPTEGSGGHQPAVPGVGDGADLMGYLKALFAEKLAARPEDLDVDGRFKDDFGVDSLVNLDIVERLEADFGFLNKTLLYEHNTLCQLHAYLVTHFGEKVQELVGSSNTAAAAASPTRLDSDSGGTAAASEPMAIVGMNGRFPKAASVFELWSVLKDGRHCIGEVPPERWDWRDYDAGESRQPGKAYTRYGGFLDHFDCFDSLFFNIPPRQAKQMDPQQRLFLECSWGAFEDAGYTRTRLPRETGVFVGVTTNTYGLHGMEMSTPEAVQVPDTDCYDIANRVSYFFDFHAPSLSVDTACSSSLSAVHLAVRSLRQGECRMALVGGVSLTLHPHRIIQFCQKGMLSESASCHPFGTGKGGFVDGEGVVAIVLKPLSQALVDGDQIHGLILGTSINASGRTSGYTVPNPRTQVALISQALDDAGVSARSLSYVEAHGTGTLIGDPIEFEGLCQAFRRHTEDRGFCALGSLKSNVGHMIAAAGLGGLIKVLLQMRHQTLAPSLNCDPPNPHIDFDASPFVVQRDLGPWPRPKVVDHGREQVFPRRAGVSSFGVGGANAHAILEEFDDQRPTVVRESYIVPVSARSRERLQESADNLRRFIEDRSDLALADIALTLQIGREAMEERHVFVVKNRQELLHGLKQLAAGTLAPTRTGKSATLGNGGTPAAGSDEATLVQRWLAGHEVDWLGLYGSARPRIVSLPTYPFARIRHWLDRSPAKEGAPVVSTRTVTSRLSPEDPLFRDHLVQNESVLPGAYHLELLAADLGLAGHTQWTLDEFTWLVPFKPNSSQRRLILSLTLAADGFELECRGDVDGSDQRYAQGRGTLATVASDEAAVFDEGDFLHRPGVTTLPVTAASFYQTLGEHGYHYGGSLRGVQEVQVAGGRATARLRQPEPGHGSDTAILDSAFQVALYLSLKGAGGGVPYRLTNLRFLDALPRAGTVHVDMVSTQEARLQLFDKSGKPCLMCGSLLFKGAMAQDQVRDTWHLLVPRWQTVPWTPSIEVQRPSVTAILYGSGAADAAQRLATEFSRPLMVELGDDGSTSSKLAERQDLQEVFVLLGRAASGIDGESLKEFNQRGVPQLLEVVRSLFSHAGKALVVHVVALGATVWEDQLHPLSAAIGGFVACLRREFPRWQVTFTDACFQEFDHLQTETLTSKLWRCRRQAPATVLLRGGEIRERVFHSYAPSMTRGVGDDGGGSLRFEGGYIILGGSGGIGRELAKNLASRFHARLVLVGRRPFGQVQKQLIQDIRGVGGEAIYMEADIRRSEEVQRVLQRSRASLGQVHGVFHSAVLLGDGATHTMTHTDFIHVAATKIDSAVHLFEELQRAPIPELEFVVFFSSLLALRGNAGQANYVAGCAFVDALAGYWDRRVPYSVQSINWGHWGETGIVSGDAYRERLARLGFVPMSTKEGLAAVDICLGTSLPQLAVFKGDVNLLGELDGCLGKAVSQVGEGTLSLIKACGGELSTLSTAADPTLDNYSEGYAALERHAGLLLIQAFQHLGVLPSLGHIHHMGRRLALAPRHERLFRAQLDILVRQGLVRRTGDDYQATAKLHAAETAKRLESIAVVEERLLRRWPGVGKHLALLKHCVNRYGDLLTGRASATEVMFPGASMELVSGIYKDNPSADYFNNLVARSVKAYVTAAKAQGLSIRILEIGAGTGGTSHPVLQALAEVAGDVEFIYTDVSPGFTNYGRRQFGTYDFVDFRVLDIEKEPLGQGFAAADLVLATNVLHATTNIQRTLSHVRSLIKPCGTLILNEMTGGQDLLTMTFGLLDGWWLAEDQERRLPHGPLLSVEKWRDQLAAMGFSPVLALGDHYELNQSVIVAEQTGFVETVQELPYAPALTPARRQAAMASAATHPSQGQPPQEVPVFDETREHISDTIVAAVADILGLAAADIDCERPFSEYGIDSILGVELVNRINDKFATDLSKTVLFDYTNVEQLSTLVAKETAVAANDERSDWVEQAVITCIAGVLEIPVDQVDTERAFSDYGIDSINGVELVNLLNDKLGLDLSKTVLYDYTTARQLSDHIAICHASAPGQQSSEHSEPLPERPPTGKAPSADMSRDLIFAGLVDHDDLTYRFRTSVETNNCLRDHVIYGRYIMPTDAYMEMVYLAARQVLGMGADGLEISRLNLGQPLILNQGDGVEVSVAFQVKGSHTAFTIASRRASTELWQTHVDGRVVPLSEKDTTTEMSTWVGATIVTPEMIYTPDAILKVGPTYQTIREIKIKGNEAQSRLSISPDGEPLRPSFALQPAIVDGLFATCLYFASHLAGSQRHFYIPVMLDRVRIYGELGESNYRAHVRMTRHTSERATCDMDLVGDDGRLVMAFRGFHLQKIGAHDLAKSPTVSDSPLTVEPRPVPALDEPVRANGQSIAIIGMAGRFPDAADVNEFWQNLAAGRDSIVEVPRERWDPERFFDADRVARNKTYSKWGGFLADIDRFDALFFQISGKEAELSDPEHRLFLEECWKAVEDAGYSDKELSNSRCGVFVGSAKGDYQLKMHHEEGAAIDGPSFPGNETSVLAARISYFMNLKGPAIAVNTACSSSLVSIHLAAQSLLAGECDMAIAGGVHICTTPLFYLLTSKAGMLSPTGRCHAFGEAADGFVPGEAVAAIVLKPLDRALADGDHIYGVLRGSGVNQDGKTNGMTAPSALSQAELEFSVYERAGVSADAINYVETHGTGTKLGDPIEISALTQAFRKFTSRRQYCPVGSVKTNIGHAARAAGIASVIKVLLSLKHRQLPPSLHCQHENDYIDFEASPFFVNKSLTPWQPGQGQRRLAAVSSFGISGTNCHLLIEEPPTLPRRRGVAWPCYPIVVSAKTSSALSRRLQDLMEWIQGAHADVLLEDVSFTLTVGRSHMSERMAFLTTSMDELRRIATAYNETGCLPEQTEVMVSGKVKKDRRIQAETAQTVKDAAASLASPERFQDVLKTLLLRFGEGYDVDWRPLFERAGARRLALPVYPFEGERYWIPEDDRLPMVQIAPPVHVSKHPFIDRLNPGLSLGEGMVFEKEFTGDEPIVAAHRVAGQGLLPGVVPLEMAWAALRELGMEGVHLRQCVWMRALVFHGESVLLRLYVKGLPTEVSFELKHGDELLFQARAEGHALSSPIESDRPDLGAIRGRCIYHYDGAEVYRPESPGVVYGPVLQVVRQVWSSDTEALAEIHLGGVDPSAGFVLNPVLLDGAMQTSRFLGGVPSFDLRPFSLDSLKVVKRGPWPSKAYAYVRKTAANCCRIQILDEHEQVVLTLEDLLLRAPTVPVDKAARERASMDDLSEYFFQPTWECYAPVSSEKPSHVVIWGERRYEAVALEIAKTYASSDIIWRDDVTDDERLAARLGMVATPCDLVFAAGLSVDEPWSPLSFTVEGAYGVQFLLRVVKAMERLGLLEHVSRFKVLTNNNDALLPTDIITPCSASLAGFAKVMQKEFPRLQVSHCDIDLKDSDPSASLAAALSFWDVEFAVRGGAAYRRRLEPVPLTALDRSGAFRQRGTYLIIGGAGGIGLALARYLAETYQAGVALLGRRPEDDGLRKVAYELETLGGRMIYLRADASDEAALKRAISEAEKSLGPITGVIHSALVLKDRAIVNMSEADLRDAMRPKVEAAWATCRAVASMKLDFLAFFGSGQSFTCFPGQSNYAAGCTFNDSLARAAAQHLPFPVKMINWGYWGSVGAVANDAVRQRMEAVGVRPITPEEGWSACEQILASPSSQVVFIKGTDDFLATIGAERDKATPVSPSESGAFVAAVEDYARDILATVLKVRPTAIESEDGFESFGVDSLVAMDVVRRFERDVGKLPATLLFEHRSLAALTTFLAHTYEEKLRALLNQPTSKVEGRSLPRPAAAESLVLPRSSAVPKARDVDHLIREVEKGHLEVSDFIQDLTDNEVDQLLEHYLAKADSEDGEVRKDGR